MVRTFAFGTLATLCLSASSFAAIPTVSQVDVEIDLEAIGNPKAAAYWTSIADDLENAIVARLAALEVDPDKNPIELRIDLSEVSLSGGLTETLGLEETRLVGDVKVVTPIENNRIEPYQLTVDVNAARIYIPEGVDVVALPSDSPVYYEAMIAAFAQGVVDRIE